MEFSLSSKNVADILHNEDNSQLLTDNMYKWKDEHKTMYVENIITTFVTVYGITM